MLLLLVLGGGEISAAFPAGVVMELFLLDGALFSGSFLPYFLNPWEIERNERKYLQIDRSLGERWGTAS